MKRHLRIAIDATTIIGHCLRNSGWFPSVTFRLIKTETFKPTYSDHQKFSARVSEMLGFEWESWSSSFVYENVMRSDLSVDILKTTPFLKWLDANVTSLWLPCTTTYRDSMGWLRQDVQIWFQDEGDATLFALAFA